MRIIAISDPHTKLPTQLPKGDVLVIAGDLTFNGREILLVKLLGLILNLKNGLRSKNLILKRLSV